MASKKSQPDEVPSGQDRANFVEYLHETEIECAALADSAIRDSMDETRWLKLKRLFRVLILFAATLGSIVGTISLGRSVASILNSGDWEGRWTLFSVGVCFVVLLAITRIARYTALTELMQHIESLKHWSSSYLILVDKCRKERHMRASAAKSRGELDDAANAIEREKAAIDRDYHPNPDDLIKSRRHVRQEMQDTDYDPIKTLRVEEVRGVPTEIEEFNQKLAEAEALSEIDNNQSRV